MFTQNQMAFPTRYHSRGKGIFKNINERINIIIDLDPLNVDTIEEIIRKYIFEQNIYIVSNKDVSINSKLLDTITNNNNTINFASYEKNKRIVISYICGKLMDNTIIVTEEDKDKYNDMIRLYQTHNNKLFFGSDIKALCQDLNKYIIQKINKRRAIEYVEQDEEDEE